MGSFDKVKQFLIEVTYNLDKSVARDKKLASSHNDKMNKGMADTMSIEPPAKTEKKRSQLLKVGSNAHGKAKRARANTDKFLKFRKDMGKKASPGKYVGDSTEILSILKSLKESFEKGLITEKAFLELAKPIVDSMNEGSLGRKRDDRIYKSAMKAGTKVNGVGAALDKYESKADLSMRHSGKVAAKYSHRRKNKK